MSMTTSPLEESVAGEAGFVIEAKGYLLALEGLPSARVNSIIVNAKGQRAMVTALHEDSVQALLLDPGSPEAGDRFMAYKGGIRYSFGDHLFGRTLNVLGEPIDGGRPLPEATVELDLEASAPTMSQRAPMVEQLITGMPVVDVLVPMAKGQRQLILGPLSSGKNQFIESVFSNLGKEGVVCIYAFIGRPVEYVEEVIGRIFAEGGNKNVVAIASFSHDPAPMISLMPTVALDLAEFFSAEGKDVVVVLDDLGTHAKYLREIALLSGEIPGRESYPGDMFYQQARILERGGQFNDGHSKSITVLPVLETNLEDLSNLVSTNLISATDGQLFFSSLLHSEGVFPAVVPSQSVTRVGRNSQSKLSTQLSLRVLALLSEHERQQRYSEFGTQLSEKTRTIIAQGEIAKVLLNQKQTTALSIESQIILLSLVFTDFFKDKDVAFARRSRELIVKAVENPKKDASVEAVVAAATRGSVSLDQFLKKLSAVVPYFLSVCQQP